MLFQHKHCREWENNVLWGPETKLCVGRHAEQAACPAYSCRLVRRQRSGKLVRSTVSSLKPPHGLG